MVIGDEIVLADITVVLSKANAKDVRIRTVVFYPVNKNFLGIQKASRTS